MFEDIAGFILLVVVDKLQFIQLRELLKQLWDRNRLLCPADFRNIVMLRQFVKVVIELLKEKLQYKPIIYILKNEPVIVSCSLTEH